MFVTTDFEDFRLNDNFEIQSITAECCKKDNKKPKQSFFPKHVDILLCL